MSDSAKCMVLEDILREFQRDSRTVSVAAIAAFLAVASSTGECSISDVIDITGDPQPSVTGNVAKLCRSPYKWLKKRRGRLDERAVFVSLTPKGKAIVSRIMAINA